MQRGGGFPGRPLLILTLAGSILSVLIGFALAQDGQANLKKLLSEVQWTKGPATANLGPIAEIPLPEDYLAAGGDDTRRLMEAMENPPTGIEVGFVAPYSFDWYVVFEFEEIGYVKDDEKDSLNADAMLASIKEGTEAGNKERAKRGWPPLTILGWERPPHYNPETQNLQWAVRARGQDELVVNYNTRVLGRKGVMRVTLVTDPSRLQEVLPEFGALLKGFSFTRGNRYAEWVAGDKVAQYGLTALVVGGATAVAAQTGLLKSLWKILVAAAVGAAALLRRLFGRKRETAPAA